MQWKSVIGLGTRAQRLNAAQQYLAATERRRCAGDA